jgi:hypothetical protein
MKLVYLMLATATLLPAASQAKWRLRYGDVSDVREPFKKRVM